ncbi:MAG: 50S ribosomal protein L10 [Desulfobacterales bacterium]|nr:50S ribosomal protein L10 [Desulfobacterales bacterium]
MNLEEKKEIVEELHEKFLKSQIVILTDYKGLDVDTINSLRRKLREADTEYRVVKNTLLVRASQGTDIAPIQPHFKGPTAVALSYEDPVAPAKALVSFAKDHKNLEIKAALLKSGAEGKVLDADAVKALSDLPSREVLLSQVLSTMNGVPTAFVRALINIPQKFLYVLQALKEQKEAA